MILHASTVINFHLHCIPTAGGGHADAQDNSPAWEKGQTMMGPCHRLNSVNVMENLAQDTQLGGQMTQNI